MGRRGGGGDCMGSDGVRRERERERGGGGGGEGGAFLECWLYIYTTLLVYSRMPI